MPLIPRVTACSAVLLAAVALAATGATRGAGAVAATRVRTVAITPMRIRVLGADGRRLAWGDGFQRIQVFDRVTNRATAEADLSSTVYFPDMAYLTLYEDTYRHKRSRPAEIMRFTDTTPEEAVQAFEDLRGRILLGIHWGTFDLSEEPLGEPPERMLAEASRRGIPPERAWILKIGETRYW